MRAASARGGHAVSAATDISPNPYPAGERTTLARAGVPPLIAPEGIEALLRDTSTASSSALGWAEFRVDVHENHLPAEVEIPPSRAVCLLLCLSPVNRLVQSRGSSIHEGQARPGDLTLLPAGIPSRWYWSNTTSVVHVYLEPQLLSRIAEEAGWASGNRVEIRSVCTFRDPFIAHLVLGLKSGLEAGAMRDRLYGDCLGTALAAHLLRHYCVFSPKMLAGERGGLPRHRLKQVLEHIKENLGRPLRLGELAGVARVSRSHFALAFRQSTGLSPHQYVLQSRVEAAKALLRRRDGAISAVSAELGFSDQSHFTRVFRSIVGTTPRRYLDRR